MFEKDFFTHNDKSSFKKGLLGTALFIAVIVGLVIFLLSPGVDYLWFKTRVFLDGQAIDHAFSRNSDLSNKVFSGLNLSGSTFPDVNLRNADLSKTDLKNAIFKNCDLTGANLKEADLRNAYFISCNLNRVKLQFANLSKVDFQGSNLQFTLLGDANFTDCNIKNADFRGAAGLSTSELIKTKNWHEAVFDIETAQTIKMDFSAEGKVAPGYPDWNDWLAQQKKYSLSVSDLKDTSRLIKDRLKRTINSFRQNRT